VSTARAIRRAAIEAASSAPSRTISRVLANPATGALARMPTATCSFIAVAMRKLPGIGAKEEREPQSPHQNDGGKHPILLPATPGGHHARAQAYRPAHPLEQLREHDILHQGNGREATHLDERLAPDEHRLVAGRNAGEPRAKVHEPRDHRKERMGPLDAHV